MKYSIIILASLFALAGTAQATEDSQLTEDEITDIRVECIASGIADELEDDQMQAFVEQCLQDGLAARIKFKQAQG